VGHLGADYEVNAGKVRFKKIYRGWSYDEERRGPLSDHSLGIKEGDYLLEIDGDKLDANTTPAQLMLNKVGRTVALLVNDKPNEVGARIVRVKPIASEIAVRYTEWLEENTKRVAKLSNGRIGYMHIRNTAVEGMIDFTRGYWAQTDKDALLVDERWNGGGYIQPWFVDTLARKIHAGIQRRAGADSADMAAMEGPIALLVNGYAGSGGDFFPWMFRQSKVGTIIGKRTWGGLVGIQGFTNLVDGGGVTSPGFAIFDRTTGEIIAENTGVTPDIDVDNRPDLVAKGQDPQLERAVAHLLEQLKNWPGKPVRKDIPKVGKDGRIGG
jgi:tricorn protease